MFVIERNEFTDTCDGTVCQTVRGINWSLLRPDLGSFGVTETKGLPEVRVQVTASLIGVR